MDQATFDGIGLGDLDNMSDQELAAISQFADNVVSFNSNAAAVEGIVETGAEAIGHL